MLMGCGDREGGYGGDGMGVDDGTVLMVWYGML